jgi:hypothetical protein
MAITIDDIEALRRRLTELPRHRPTEVSKQEAVNLLASELSAARRRGYSPEELAQLLSEQGVMINAPTLRGYLRQSRKRRRRGEGWSGRKGTARGEATTSQRAIPPESSTQPAPQAGAAPGRAEPAAAGTRAPTEARRSRDAEAAEK